MNIDIKEVNEAVVEFCVDVIQNPLMHFNESDLHFFLCDRLNRKFKSELSKNTFKTKLNPVINNSSHSTYQACLLHLEYGANKGRATDIVIFDKSDIKNINNHNLQYKNGSVLEYLRPKFGFEIGTEKSGVGNNRIKDHIKKDAKKLEECEFGYLIHIIRDTNQGEQRDKMQLLKDRFKKPIKGKFNNLENSSQIKIIGILLYLFRKENQIRCEIFNPNYQGYWEPLYDKDLEDKDKIKK